MSAAMRRQSVPDQQHGTPLDLVQLGQELDQCFVVVGARTQFKEEVRITAVGFVRQGTSQRQPFPGEAMVKHGCWPLGAQVARTDGSSDTPDPSSNTISAFWRCALFSVVASGV